MTISSSFSRRVRIQKRYKYFIMSITSAPVINFMSIFCRCNQVSLWDTFFSFADLIPFLMCYYCSGFGGWNEYFTVHMKLTKARQ